jgi:hypothetical protein
VLHSPQSRPLDALAISVTVALCLTWGFNQAAIKLAIHDIPPLIQSAARSVIAAFLVGAWTQLRGIPLFKRDGTLPAGIAAGALFALEFVLIYRGLIWTTATRAVLFIYLAPFFVVLWFAVVHPGRSFSSVAVVWSVDVLRRHRHRLRPANTGRRSASNARRSDDGGRRGRMGRHHAGHQGKPTKPRQRREDHALPACGLGAPARRRGPGIRRTHHRNAVGTRARRPCLPGCFGW